jgi:hypothetical protein
MADLKEKIVKLDEYLAKQRLEWTETIKDLTVQLKKGINLEEVSSYTLSYRQILVEHMSTMGNRIKTQKAVVDRKYKEKWLEYYNFDYKLTDKQRERFIDADLAEDKQMLSILESQKSFLEGSIKTLDNMGFAIKNRLDMSKI